MLKSNTINLLLITLLIAANNSFLHSQVGAEWDSKNDNFVSLSGENFGDLIWSDECNGEGMIDPSKWFHQTRLPAGSSWFNGEIQHYTGRIENSFYDSGYMHIVAIKGQYTDQGVTKDFTSARLNSKFAFTYGKVEVRAILPEGPGTWPAIWMLGKNITENGGYWQTQGFATTPWPACGEIDIMEHWGTNQDYISSAMHTPSSFGNTSNKGGRIVDGVSEEFHTYVLEWTPEKMVFSVDSVIHYTYNPDVKDDNTWPFDADQYLLLNIAILSEISDNFTESSMIIDYVRIYEYVGSTSIGVGNPVNARAYPNPVHDMINLELEGTISPVVSIYSADGNLLYNKCLSPDTRQLDLSSLPKGIYLITIRSEGSEWSEKLIKL